MDRIASNEDSLGSLYADHDIEDEIIVGPMEIRKPTVTFKFKVPEKDPEPTNSRSCDICKESFQNEHTFKKHMMKHAKERSIICNVCQKAYKHMSSLRVHKCSKPEKKQFECQYCPKSFSIKGHLQAHTRLHTGEKPYRCDMCSKEFTQQTSLNNHVLKHKGIKPHRCELCYERFRQVSNLKKHIELKHADKNIDCHQKTRKLSNISLVWYSCKNCHVVLSGRGNINKHMEICKLKY